MDEATREAVVRTLRDGLFDLGIDDVDDGELIDIADAILALLSASAQTVVQSKTVAIFALRQIALNDIGESGDFAKIALEQIENLPAKAERSI